MAIPADTEPEIWVLDTSSVIEIKQVAPKQDWKAIFQDLSQLVSSGNLVYPKQVIAELDAGSLSRGYDRPFEWAKKNGQKATRHGNLFEELAVVMNHQTASRVCDPNKAFGPEEADPYVLALALHLKQTGRTVTVLAEESKSTPHKLAINQACGALKLYAMKVEVFLVERGIYPKPAPPVSRSAQIPRPRPRPRKPVG